MDEAVPSVRPSFSGAAEDADSWEGGHYVPKVGLDAVEEFRGTWPQLVDAVSHSLRCLSQIQDDVVGDLRDVAASNLVVCAVANPSAKDCPLVYLSKGFEEMTGYPAEFALGRNCRFLQPNLPSLNNAINGDELARMRTFCKLKGADAQGASRVSLLLNERKSGDRFWNLLHMQYVAVDEKPYILGVQIILDLPMPSMLQCETASTAAHENDEAQFQSFVDELRTFLEQLRDGLTGEALVANTFEIKDEVTRHIKRFMKEHCQDYEGDHKVPVVGLDRAWIFQQEVKWAGILEQVQDTLYKVWEVIANPEESPPVACMVSDPLGEDCPLVYVSREFEKVTGYAREWAVGRNFRFLQPNDRRRNLGFNEDESRILQAFCWKPQPKGTRMVNLMVNEHKNGYPFWNLMVTEHIEATTLRRGGPTRRSEQRPYVFSVLTCLDFEVFKLSELLAMDADALTEIARLRAVFRNREPTLDGRSLRSWAKECVAEWTMDLPVLLQVPRIPFRRLAATGDPPVVPLVGLEVDSSSVGQLVPSGLEDGVRHFYIGFSERDRAAADKRVIELQARLLALRLAELLTYLQRHHFHYLRSAMAFTLMTPPLYVEHFFEILKALRSHGYRLDCWMLDLRNGEGRKCAQAPSLTDCWTTMVQAVSAGDVRALGVCGGTKEHYDKLHRGPAGAVPPAVWGVEMYPGKTSVDRKEVNFYEQLLASDITVVAYNPFGPKNALLEEARVKEEAHSMKADPAIMLMKWVEVQGYAVLANRLRANPRKGAVPGRRASATTAANVHREFVKEFRNAPAAVSLFRAMHQQAECAPAHNIAGTPVRRYMLLGTQDLAMDGGAQSRPPESSPAAGAPPSPSDRWSLDSFRAIGRVSRVDCGPPVASSPSAPPAAAQTPAFTRSRTRRLMTAPGGEGAPASSRSLPPLPMASGSNHRGSDRMQAVLTDSSVTRSPRASPIPPHATGGSNAAYEDLGIPGGRSQEVGGRTTPAAETAAHPPSPTPKQDGTSSARTSFAAGPHLLPPTRPSDPQTPGRYVRPQHLAGSAAAAATLPSLPVYQPDPSESAPAAPQPSASDRLSARQRQARMVARLASKHFSPEDIAETLELEVAEVKALLDGGGASSRSFRQARTLCA